MQIQNLYRIRFLVVTSLFVLLVSCSSGSYRYSNSVSWEKAKADDTIDSFERYLYGFNRVRIENDNKTIVGVIGKEKVDYIIKRGQSEVKAKASSRNTHTFLSILYYFGFPEPLTRQMREYHLELAWAETIKSGNKAYSDFLKKFVEYKGKKIESRFDGYPFWLQYTIKEGHKADYQDFIQKNNHYVAIAKKEVEKAKRHRFANAIEKSIHKADFHTTSKAQGYLAGPVKFNMEIVDLHSPTARLVPADVNLKYVKPKNKNLTFFVADLMIGSIENPLIRDLGSREYLTVSRKNIYLGVNNKRYYPDVWYIQGWTTPNEKSNYRFSVPRQYKLLFSIPKKDIKNAIFVLGDYKVPVIKYLNEK